MGQQKWRWLVAALTLIFLYRVRGILGPFIAAALAAYILTPLVAFITQQLKLPRTAAVVLIYLVFVSLAAALTALTSGKLLEEAREFRSESNALILQARDQLISLPEWERTLVVESVRSLQDATRTLPLRILPYFTGAVTQLVHVLLFLTATFYLLSDGGRINKATQKVFNDLLPGREILFDRLSRTFARYLEGQLILVLLMATVSFLALTALGVKYSLLLALFTGFAEIIPVIGPITAALLAGAVAMVDGVSRFGLTPLNEALAVFITYFVLRQLEDIVVIPKIMGQVARVHPLLILLAVLAGGQLAGLWGLLLAVPALAAVRIVVGEYW